MVDSVDRVVNDIIYTTTQIKTLEQYANDYATLRERAVLILLNAQNGEQEVKDVYLPTLSQLTDNEIKTFDPILLLRLIVFHSTRVLPLLRETGYNQYVLSTELVGIGETEIVIFTPIPQLTTPQTGILTIKLDNATYLQVNYTSWVDSTFTIEATDFDVNVASALAEVYIGY